MAQKKKKIKLDPQTAKEITYLKKLQALSFAEVNGRSPVLDSLFTDQAQRLQLQIDKLK